MDGRMEHDDDVDYFDSPIALLCIHPFFVWHERRFIMCLALNMENGLEF